MHTTIFTRTALLALLLSVGAAHAQSTDTSTTAPASVSSDTNVPPATARKQAMEVAAGDPARWTREDVTAADRLKTLRKETAAALQESLGNCKRLAQAERATCVKEARTIYQQEMASLQERLSAGR
jgi:hypothetical protein